LPQMERGIDCKTVVYSLHAMKRMVQRQVTPSAVESAIGTGSVIAHYPDDVPYPSKLLLIHYKDRPLHVLVAKDPETGECVVVTVYEADESIWENNFKKRRKS
jgi:hypothetical protein